MVRQHARFEWLESFGPSIWMVVLSALWYRLGSARAELQVNHTTDDEYLSHSEHEEDQMLQSLTRLLDASSLTVWDQVAYFIILALAFEAFNYVAVNTTVWNEA